MNAATMLISTMTATTVMMAIPCSGLISGESVAPAAPS
jgi:hypothetical protein